MPRKSYLSMNGEVSAVLRAGAPVVALESTIITHGMPYPQNLAMARAVEALVELRGRASLAASVEVKPAGVKPF